MGKTTMKHSILIAAKDVTKTYGSGPSTVKAIDGISLDIYRGEILAIMGPSGCGKSTLLNILSGLDVNKSGTVTIDGIDIGQLRGAKRAAFRRQYCGFVFQNLMLLPPATVYDNVEAPLILAGTSPEERKQLVPAMIERVGMKGFEHHLPDELSGGQQQRIGIARSLILSPQIIFADEPTSNLDSENARMITELLVSVARSQQATVIIVTHDPLVAAYADRTIALHSGHLTKGERK